MRRTQLYIEDDLWETLRIRSQQSKSSISDLVREAVREKYASGLACRRHAMRAFAGLWRDRTDLPRTRSYVRRLRKGTRLRRVR